MRGRESTHRVRMSDVDTAGCARSVRSWCLHVALARTNVMCARRNSRIGGRAGGRRRRRGEEGEEESKADERRRLQRAVEQERTGRQERMRQDEVQRAKRGIEPVASPVAEPMRAQDARCSIAARAGPS